MIYNTIYISSSHIGYMSKFVENIKKWHIFLDFPNFCSVNLYSRMVEKLS